MVFSILQYLIRDKPNRIRLTESSLSSIVTCLLTPGTGMQLAYVLAISSFLCTLDIPDDDLPLISSSALLPALFLSSGVQCCEYNSALDIEKERSALCSAYHLHSNKNSVAVSTEDDSDPSHSPISEEEEATQKNALLDNIIQFQFNLVLRNSRCLYS